MLTSVKFKISNVSTSLHGHFLGHGGMVRFGVMGIDYENCMFGPPYTLRLGAVFTRSS